MFPLIFNVCVCTKFPVFNILLALILFRTSWMKCVQKIFKGKFMCALSFLVRSSHDLCARAHMHSLERTLPITVEYS